MKRNAIAHPAIDFAMQALWMQDTTAKEALKSQLVDQLLEDPMMIGLDTATVLKWFGEPVHRRYLANNEFIYIYFPSLTASYKGQPCDSMLFCIEFDRKCKTQSVLLYFIESDTAAEFWCSGQLPSVSYEFDNDGFVKHFYRRF